MGLDCTAYSHMEHKETLPLKPGTRLPQYPEDDANFFDDLYANGGQVVFAEGFGHNSIEGLVPGGIYYPTSETTTMGWRAGSYSGYGEWRNSLARAILGVDAADVWNDHDKYRDEPFFELIDFSDCEGVLGPVACQNLAEDFRQNREKFVAFINRRYPSDGEYFIARYDEWSEAVALGAQDGMVVFH